MSDMLTALDRTHAWDLVPFSPGKVPIFCRWVYKIKTCAEGYKAQLVARGFTQEYGIDYEETFAPIAKITRVHALIVVAAARGCHFPN